MGGLPLHRLATCTVAYLVLIIADVVVAPVAAVLVVVVVDVTTVVVAFVSRYIVSCRAYWTAWDFAAFVELYSGISGASDTTSLYLLIAEAADAGQYFG